MEDEVGSDEVRRGAEGMRDQAVRVERRMQTDYVSVTSVKGDMRRFSQN